MANFNHSHFLTKNIFQENRITFYINTLPHRIHINIIPPPTLLRDKSDSSPTKVGRIGSEVERRKYGHVREEIGR